MFVINVPNFSGTMKLPTLLVLLLHQNDIASALRMIENGLGEPIFMDETLIENYAILADDKKANLPTQVNELQHSAQFLGLTPRSYSLVS